MVGLKYRLDSFPVLKKILLAIYSPTFGKFFKYRKKNIFNKNANNALRKIDSVLRSHGVVYWLDFGTLLGVIREGNFIEHDIDIDIGMWLSDYSAELPNILCGNGFKLIRRISIDEGKYGLEETYSIYNVNIDIFFYTKLNNDLAFYHDFIPLMHYSRIGTIKKIGGLITRELTLSLSAITEIDFKGGKYFIPMPIDRHLIDRYGENYLIPDKSWDITKGAKENVEILDKIGKVDFFN